MVTGEDRPHDALAQLRSEHGGWLDSNPYYLMIVLADGRFAEIDLGGRGWLARYGEAGFLRAPGSWYLVRKEGQTIVAMLNVNEDDQPYYVAKHVGFTSVGGDGPARETIVYGLGKKRPDGATDRLWLLSNGAITVGEDIELIAITLLRQGHLPS
jgi:hypothetical protein